MAIRFSDDEHRKIEKLAHADSLPASTWGRVQLLRIVAAAALAVGCGGVDEMPAPAPPPAMVEIAVTPDAMPVAAPSDGGMAPVAVVAPADMTPVATPADMTPVACGAPRDACDPHAAPCCSGSCLRSNDNVLLLCCMPVNFPCGEPRDARCCPGTTCRPVTPFSQYTFCLP